MSQNNQECGESNKLDTIRKNIINEKEKIHSTNPLKDNIPKFIAESENEEDSTQKKQKSNIFLFKKFSVDEFKNDDDEDRIKDDNLLFSSVQTSEIEKLINRNDKNAEEYFDMMKQLSELKESQDYLITDLLCEVDSLTKGVQVLENSIQDTNSKITQESEEKFEEDLQKMLKDNTEGKDNLENYHKLKEFEAKKKIEDLESSLTGAKKSLNSKMIELQKLKESMKEEENVEEMMNQEIEGVKDKVDIYEEINSRLQWEINEVLMKKKFLNNEIQNYKGNIRVHVRIRDFLQGEKRESCISTKENKYLGLRVPQQFMRSNNSQNQYNFKFEHIYDQGSSQSQIFDDVSPLIQSICDGYNVCIFAYGQTGAGKTHTLIGENTEERKGILPRALDSLLQRVDFMRKNQWDCKIKASFSELYMDNLYDLLSSQRNKVEAQNFIEIQDREQLSNFVEIARKNRTTGKTQSNDQSSRSHAIFQIQLECAKNKTKSRYISNGCLNIIDLAGSERLNLSQVHGSMKQETISINKSLTSLSKVIISLAKKGNHIPYRNSKLTYLLKDYLGANSKTLVIVTLNPCVETFGLTLSSLKFANNLKRVEYGHALKKNVRVTSKKFRKEEPGSRRNYSSKKDMDRLRQKANFENQRFNRQMRSNRKNGDFSMRGSPGKIRMNKMPYTKTVASSRQETVRRNSQVFQTPQSKKGVITFIDPAQNLSDKEVLEKAGLNADKLRFMTGPQISAIVVRERNRMKNLAYKQASSQLRQYAGLEKNMSNSDINLLESEKRVESQEKKLNLLDSGSMKEESVQKIDFLKDDIGIKKIDFEEGKKEEKISHNVSQTLYGTDEKDENNRKELYSNNKEVDNREQQNTKYNQQQQQNTDYKPQQQQQNTDYKQQQQRTNEPNLGYNNYQNQQNSQQNFQKDQNNYNNHSRDKYQRGGYNNNNRPHNNYNQRQGYNNYNNSGYRGKNNYHNNRQNYQNNRYQQRDFNYSQDRRNYQQYENKDIKQNQNQKNNYSNQRQNYSQEKNFQGQRNSYYDNNDQYSANQHFN